MLLKKEAQHLLDKQAPLGDELCFIVQLVANGASNDDIAERLGYPLSEIENSIEAIATEFKEVLAS